MTYTIDNQKLSLSVKEKGAEICSLKDLTTNKEFIWEADSNIWGSSAPVLFPIIGGLKDGEYLFNGKTYKMPKHGIVRGSNKVTMIQKDAHSLEFEMAWDKETLLMYPFKFRFRISFSLYEKTLLVSHRVINEDLKTMYFSVGAHPAFNVPLFNGEQYSDYSLEFDKTENASTWLLDKAGTVSNKTQKVLRNSNLLNLHEDLFKNDALIFKDLKSRKVTLVSSKNGPLLSFSYTDFEYLGIWAKPKAPFVCIEPWLGIADSTNHNKKLEDKEGILSLEPNKSFEAEYKITVL